MLYKDVCLKRICKGVWHCLHQVRWVYQDWSGYLEVGIACNPFTSAGAYECIYNHAIASKSTRQQQTDRTIRKLNFLRRTMLDHLPTDPCTAFQHMHMHNDTLRSRNACTLNRRILLLSSTSNASLRSIVNSANTNAMDTLDMLEPSGSCTVFAWTVYVVSQT